MPEFTRFLPEKYFSRFFFGGGGGKLPPVSYAYAKDLANIFRTLPGPGEFQELVPPLVSTTAALRCDTYATSLFATEGAYRSLLFTNARNAQRSRSGNRPLVLWPIAA